MTQLATPSINHSFVDLTAEDIFLAFVFETASSNFELQEQPLVSPVPEFEDVTECHGNPWVAK